MSMSPLPYPNARDVSIRTVPRPVPHDLRQRYQEIDAELFRLGYRHLARLSGLSGPHVSRVLRAKSKTVTLETLKRIASAAKISLYDLVFYVEQRRENERGSVAA